MPRLLTIIIAIIITSLSLTGMMMARENPAWFTYDFWFSDGQVKIQVNTNSPYWCALFGASVSLDNTSTTGGGPVAMMDASLSLKLPMGPFQMLNLADVTADKGSVSITNDGTHYTIKNTIGNVAPNDIYTMHVNPVNTSFYRSLLFDGSIDSGTYDPDESNNNVTLGALFNFISPTSYYLDLLRGNNATRTAPFQYQINNPEKGLAMRFSIGYDETDCVVPFENGKLKLNLPSAFGTPTIEGSTNGASSSINGDQTIIETNLSDLQPGEIISVDVSWTDIPPKNQMYGYTLQFIADNIDTDVEVFTQEGSFTVFVDDQTMPNLQITKSANFPDSATVAQLDTLIYFLTVTNIGDADALSAVLTDSLSIPNIEFEDVQTSAGECSEVNALLSCNLGDITPGDTVLVTIKTLTKLPGIIQNYAEIASVDNDDNIVYAVSNPVVHIIADDPQSADIATEVFVVEPDSIPPNGYLSVLAVLANDGTHDASQVAFQLIFSHPVQILDSGFLSQDEIECEHTSAPVAVTRFSCLADILKADKLIIMYVSAKLVGNPAPSTFVTIMSQAAAQAPGDPDVTNNEAVTAIPVSSHIDVTQPIPSGPPDPIPIYNSTDLEVTNAFLMPPGPTFVPCLNVLAPAFLVGQNIIHTFTVRNNGPQEAIAVKFLNAIAASSFNMDYDFNSLTAALKPKCQLIPGLFGYAFLSCNLGNMGVGERITFSIMAKARLEGDPITNIAIVKSDTPDHKPFNNMAANSVSIFKLVCPILYGTDLAVMIADASNTAHKPATKSDSIRTVEVQFRNFGFAPSYHNVYVDTLPAAMHFTSMSLADTTDKSIRCVVDEVDDNGDPRHRVQCNWERHNPGEVKKLYIKGRIMQMGHLNWYSHVRSSNWDSDVSNNIDSLKLNNLLGTSSDLDEPEMPSSTTLSQNYPNPFNPSTNITFTLSQSGNVRIDVYSIDGRIVTTILNGYRNAGQHSVTLDASQLSSGVYLYRLETSSAVLTQKMALIK